MLFHKLSLHAETISALPSLSLSIQTPHVDANMLVWQTRS
jgi:hypothetical protein